MQKNYICMHAEKDMCACKKDMCACKKDMCACKKDMCIQKHEYVYIQKPCVPAKTMTVCACNSAESNSAESNSAECNSWPLSIQQ